MVGTPPDPAELRFAACRVLPRHQADPRRQFTAGAEAADTGPYGHFLRPLVDRRAAGVGSVRLIANDEVIE
jgi:hypothetical protein